MNGSIKKGYTLVMFALALSLMILTGVARAQTVSIGKVLKPVVTAEDKQKMTLQLLSQYTSDQFEYTYGRLDNMKKQLDRIEDLCAKR